MCWPSCRALKLAQGGRHAPVLLVTLTGFSYGFERFSLLSFIGDQQDACHRDFHHGDGTMMMLMVITTLRLKIIKAMIKNTANDCLPDCDMTYAVTPQGDEDDMPEILCGDADTVDAVG